MGELINLNSPQALTDADIPAEIARDTEYQAADVAHFTAADPHSQYLLQSEGDGRYRQLSDTQNFPPAAKALCGSVGGITAIGDFSGNTGLEVRGASGAAAFLFIHRVGVYGLHFGLNTDNQLGIGGSSMGAVFYRLFHEGSPVTARATIPPSNVGANSTGIGWNATTGTSDFCNYSGTGSGDAFHFYRIIGNNTTFPAPANRISRIDITGAYIQTSDKRLKSNFSSAPGLSAILALSPQKYRHWECCEYDQKTLKLGHNFANKIGLVAQDVQKIIPEAVPPANSDEELCGIDYTVIVACLVQAVKDLEAQLSSIKAKGQSV